MAAALPDVRINFDRLGLNRISNDGFETNTTGWSVSAGIQGAGSSITRTASGAYMGTAVGRLVTTSTNGSGVKFVMSSTFSASVAYRFRVYLKAVSGGTSAGIRIGSLGTPGDRATSTFTVTGTWTAYSVDFTPANNRTDIEVNVYTNAASAMTVDIDDAEVYATRDDVSILADGFQFTHGANFEGGLLAGSANVRLRNDAQVYTTGATAIVPGLPLYIRATYLGVPYGLFYGIINRGVADVATRTVTAFANDPVDKWDRTTPVTIQDSLNGGAVWSFRNAVFSTIGEPSARRSLTHGEAEAHNIHYGADDANVLSLLAEIDRSTGTLGFLAFNPSTSVLYVYTTVGRNARSSQAVDDTITSGFNGVGWDVSEDANVNAQRVNYRVPVPDADNSAIVWTYPELPLNLTTTGALTIEATFDASFNLSLTQHYLLAGPPTFTHVTQGITSWTFILTPTGGSEDIADVLQIHGQKINFEDATTYQSTTGPNGWVVAGDDIEAPWCQSLADANALALWNATRQSASFQARLQLTMENVFPTVVARNVGDLIAVTIALADPAAINYVIRTVTVSCDMAGLDWTATYDAEPAGRPLTGTAFIIDTSTLNGSALLGY